MKTLNKHDHPTTRRGRRPASRGESGWIVIAALVLATAAASVTVTWARHAVLAKGTLEMESGASSSEEAARSGLNRCREKMRLGQPPGSVEDGAEEIVVTDDGNVVTIEREVQSHKGRRLKTHARKIGGGMQEEASVKANCDVVPASKGRGERTRLTCDAGSGVLMAGNLTIISGSATYQDTQLAGLMLLEPGAELTLEDVELRGTIITRAAVCKDEPLQVDGNRPKVQLFGDIRLLAGTELPEVAVAGPDAVLTSDSNARVEIDGVTVADEIDLRGRGTVRGMMVHETSASVDSDIRRPGHGRGPQSWPTSLEAGAEAVTRMSFPATGYTTAEMDAMEACNAGNN